MESCVLDLLKLNCSGSFSTVVISMLNVLRAKARSHRLEFRKE